MKFHTQYNFYKKERSSWRCSSRRGNSSVWSRSAKRDRSSFPRGARELFGIQPGDQLLLMADKKRGIALVGMDDLHVPDSLFRLAKEADDDGNSEA